MKHAQEQKKPIIPGTIAPTSLLLVFVPLPLSGLIDQITDSQNHHHPDLL